METRQALLHRLDETVAQLLDVYRAIPNPDMLVYELWSARDVLAHLTFWHESFARNVSTLVNGSKPQPLKGRFIDLNQAGVESMRQETLESVLERFQAAHQTIRDNILYPGLALIPYKKGSRDYSPEEHLDIVNTHIAGHLRDVREALKR